jgi:exosome complex RNA-binding protein Csl4
MDFAGEELLKKLQNMNEYEFEDLVADLWEKQGWDTVVTSDSNDGGVDVIAERDTPFHRKEIIQAKRHASDSTVGSPAIQRVNSLKDQRASVDTVVVVTTNGFSFPAQEAASNLNVKTINGEQLVALVDELEAGDIINKYTSTEESERAKQTRSDQENGGHVVKKLNECIRLSEGTTENLHSMVYLDGSKSGYVVVPHQFGNEFYNVHGFMNGSNTIGRFNEKDWNEIRKISNNNGFQVIEKSEKHGGRMFVGKKGDDIPEIKEVTSMMLEFIRSVFDISPESQHSIYINNKEY